MKKVFIWIKWILLVYLALFLILSISLYMPFVQDMAVSTIEKVASDASGYKITLDKLRLRFPLTLEIKNSTALSTAQDTIFSAESFNADLKLLPLIGMKVEIKSVNLQGVKLNYQDSAQTISLKGRLDKLRLNNYEVDLKSQSVDMSQTLISGGDIRFTMLKPSPIDTTTSEPIAWRLISNRILLRDINFCFDDRTTDLIAEVSIKEGVARKGDIDLFNQNVALQQVRLDRGSYRIIMPESTSGDTTSNSVDVVDVQPSKPWIVNLNKISIEDNDFEMHIGKVEQDSGRFNPNHLFVRNINIKADSILNVGSKALLQIKDLAFDLTPHLKFKNGVGDIHYEDQLVDIKGLSIESSRSSLSTSVQLRWQMKKDDFFLENLLAQLDVRLHPEDIRLLAGDLPSQTKSKDNDELSFSAILKGRNNRVEIVQLSSGYPNLYSLNGSGWVDNIVDPDRLSADLKLKLSSQRGALIKELLPTSISKSLTLPDNMQMSAEIKALQGAISPDIALITPNGRVKLDGSIDLKHEQYEVLLIADTLSLAQFLPTDSLGLFDANIKAIGKGFDPFSPKTVLELNSKIGRFDYRNYPYRDITLDASLLESNFKALLVSPNRELDLMLDVKGEIHKSGVILDLESKLKNLDLQALHFSETPLTTALSTRANFAYDLKQAFTTSGDVAIDRLLLISKSYEPGELTFQATNQDSLFKVALRSGDLRVNLDAKESLESIMASMERLTNVLLEQQKDLQLDLAKIKNELPTVDFSLKSGKRNLLNNFLKQDNQTIDSISIEGGTSAFRGIHLTSQMLGLRNKESIVDSLTLNMTQDSSRINFNSRMSNRENHPNVPMRIDAIGWLENNQAEARVQQRNYDSRMGVDLGVRAKIEREKVTLSFFPEEPIIGFAPWQLNSDNYITIDKDMRINGNLQLLGDVAKIRLTPVRVGEDGNQVVALDVDGIDLSKLSDYIPYFPNMDGAVASSFLLSSGKEGMSTSGSFGIGEFIYERQRVGDLKVQVNYVTGADKKQTLETSLFIDNIEAAIIRGDISESTKLDIRVPSFPLKSINPFIPPGMAELSGFLKGALSMNQSGSSPIINGEFAFEQTQLNLLPISTTFALDSQRVNIKDSRVNFTEYKLFSGKNPPLRLNGNVDFRNLDYIQTNLRLDANNFQLLDAPKRKGAMVYGKAFIDLSTLIQGTLQKLSVTGSLNLLNQTDLTYVMQDMGVSVSNKTDELVRFVNFADTTTVRYSNREKLNELEGLDLLFNVNVAPTVRLAINLSESGNDRVDLEGGGTLSYLMNREGVNSMTGRYTLTGGNVRYDLPVIGEKLFKIVEGSKVEWNGDLTNPILNLTAKERIRASVTDESNNSRSVNFDAIVRIEKPLNQMSIVFDLDSPEDLTIQNRLTSLTQEERSKEAMNLILYGSYNLSGFNTKSASSSAVQGFLEKQMNQWARNSLKGVDLNFGIDNMDQASSGTKRTDYTVQFSKRLFNDRFKINVGGRVSTGDDPSVKQDQSFIDDLSLEYALDRRQFLFAKLFYHTGYDNVLEGKITKTGLALTMKRKLYRLKNIFKFRNSRRNEEKPKDTTQN
ncbi:MAG: translocation/assembly module TamB domain-containing protein [Bacteroidales bacterium]